MALASSPAKAVALFDDESGDSQRRPLARCDDRTGNLRDRHSRVSKQRAGMVDALQENVAVRRCARRLLEARAK
jgi:hypothetical protein